MERLIDDAVRLTRQDHETGATESVDVADVAADAWDDVATGESSLTVETTRSVEANLDRFRELLAELFQNAVRHGAGEDGRLGPRRRHRWRLFSSSTTGPVSTQTTAPEVFDQGYTTSKDGTGLGLSLVERIAAAHGWTVTVAESEREEGARFEITV